ncbi:MAG: hypothetical protein IKO86_01655 [Prevotella sp.]|nr:hypothetical protein [Prevotella sp.]
MNKFRREKDLAGKSEYGSKRCLLRVSMIGVYRGKQCLFTTLMIYPTAVNYACFNHRRYTVDSQMDNMAANGGVWRH